MKTALKNITGIKCIGFGFVAFVGILLEAVLAYGIEPMIYGVEFGQWSTAQMISHWIATCVLWGLVAYGIFRIAKSRYGIDLLAKGQPMSVLNWVIILILLVLSIVVSYMDWQGFKVVKEFQSNGWLKFVFQYLYYSFEVLLVTLILIWGQKAFEQWFKKENIPYGGIIVAVTWGMGHFLTKDYTTGVLSVILGLAFGSVYLLTNRDFKKTYLILWCMFVL